MFNFKRSTQRSRLGLALVASSLVILTVAANVAAASPSTSTSPAAAGLVPYGDGAVRINPDPSVRDLHLQLWDHVTVSANGKRLVIYFWMGPQACNGLGRVDVSRRDGQVNIELWTGIPKHRIGFLCPEYAQLYKTVVHLKRPIIGDFFA